MTKEKVCLITGAAGTVGQHLIADLVCAGYKVLALGEVADIFSPEVLKNRQIKVTTALPVSTAQFKKHDVQFCFGDMSDISFLASVFAAADKGDVEIKFLFHLTANELIQKKSPKAYHPQYGDTVNLLEITKAYWQEHKDTFKCFFYAADTGKNKGLQTEKLIADMIQKENFPAVVYKPQQITTIADGYKGKTSLSSLYRFVSPVKTPAVPSHMAWKTEADSELTYIAGLKRAVEKVLEQVKANKELKLD